MAEVEDTYVSWIDNLSESERVTYLARCEELRKTCPMLDSITLGMLAKLTDEDIEELWGKDKQTKEKWVAPPFVPPEEKVVMCFKNREELEAWEASQSK